MQREEEKETGYRWQKGLLTQLIWQRLDPGLLTLA